MSRQLSIAFSLQTCRSMWIDFYNTPNVAPLNLKMPTCSSSQPILHVGSKGGRGNYGWPIVPRWLWTRGKAIMVKDMPFWELACPLKKGTFEGDVPGPFKVGYVWIFQFPEGYDVKRCFCFKEKTWQTA